MRGVFLTGKRGYLVFGNGGKNILLSIGYCVGFVFFTRNVYNKTLLPCYEMFVRKQLVSTAYTYENAMVNSRMISAGFRGKAAVIRELRRLNNLIASAGTLYYLS